MMNETLAFDKISLLRLAFKGLKDEELREVADLTEIHTYPSGHVLCQEGAYEDIFYIIADGNVIITKKIADGEGEHVLRVGGKGDLVGEMALIQNAPRAATVRTTTECTVLEMEKRDFQTILSRSPAMAIDIIRITLDRLRSNDLLAINELKRANQVLRLMDRNKLEFIQVAAHELRTPLTVIKGYGNLLRSFPEVQANPSLEEMLDGILKGAERMHEIVNMMLDVSRIDVETLTVASVPVLLKRVLQGVIHTLGNAAAERNIEMRLEYAEDTPIIHADPVLVEKAIYQLAVNAIKYTPDGGAVTLRTRPVTLEGDLPGVEVAVQDTGIGLDPEHHELIFEKFYQVGNVALHSSGKTSFKGGGAGLGLALVRGVARAHGGKVWVESSGHDEVNYPGCTFYLQLPLQPPEKK
ncbi:MAG: ATP-binding protein [Anaerolineales bacterium]|nr:ATP-binding protein [Anaerolineales bacterium]MCX7756434.1 ATP-binding protein [Anaerolineales bacterium]MDW8277739.1 ATP-binding protein [Anaerolineales bacterium]